MLNIPQISGNTNMKECALAYLKAGFSIVPANGKIPSKNWKVYQNQKPTVEEIECWWTENPRANIAVITGKISGIIVVDIDGVDTNLELPPTLTSSSSPGHFHYFYCHPGVPIKSSTSEADVGVDIRGDGGVIILPPSVHFNSGKEPDGLYQWLSEPSKTEISSCPSWLLTSYAKNKKEIRDLVRGVNQGSRNSNATIFIGSMLAHYPESDWESICWPIITAWNDKNNPPLPEKELRSVFNSISQKEMNSRDSIVESEPEKINQADQLVGMVLDGADLLLNQFGEAYIAFSPVSYVAYKIDSEKIKQQLCSLYWSKNHKTVKSESVSNAIATLEGLAMEKNNRQHIYNRVAKVDDTIYYDLINQNQIIKITSQGWSLETTCPAYFTRYSHQKPQVIPDRGGKLEDIFQLLNLKNKASKVLICTYLPTCLITNIPRVALVLHGDHGSAKSTCLKLLRSLLDPSELALLTPPAMVYDLVQIASHHFVLYFDNLSELSPQLSDTLCRLVTGDGFSKRQLYTDNDDVIYSFKSLVGFNGINLVATRADLLDRSVIISLERISEDQRKSEVEIYNQFEKIKPELLGAIFDAVSKMLRIEPTLTFSKKPRMADYYGFATAAALALGYSRSELDDAFNQNTKEQNIEAIEASPTAQTIMEFIKDKNGWNGSSTNLYNHLLAIAEDLKLKNNFPKSPTWLWRRIREVRVNLTTQGVEINRSETAQRNIITITKLTAIYNNASTVTTTTIQDLKIPASSGGNGGNGDINGNIDRDKNRKLDVKEDSNRMLKIIEQEGLFQ